MNTLNKASITDVIQDVVSSLGDVVRNEVRLAKAEAKAGLKDVTGGITWLAAGLALLIPAITLVGFAGAGYLAERTALDPPIANAIVGIAFAMAAVLLIQLGRKAMASESLSLPTTIDNIKQDFQALKETTQ